jgi:uncharacterized protein YkwD
MCSELESVLENKGLGTGDHRIVPRTTGRDPRRMRRVLVGLLTTVALLLIPALGQAATKASRQASSEQQVLVLLNQIRADHNLTPFAASNELRDAARSHSSDMLKNGYFEHDGLKETWDARIARYLKSPLIAENIARGQGAYGTPQGIVSQWMHSPPHRAIILTPGLHQVGLGIASGTYHGSSGAVIATADFAA